MVGLTVSGTGFYADGTGGDQLRLCYSQPAPERIREGVTRLDVRAPRTADDVALVLGSDLEVTANGEPGLAAKTDPC